RLLLWRLRLAIVGCCDGGRKQDKRQRITDVSESHQASVTPARLPMPPCWKPPPTPKLVTTLLLTLYWAETPAAFCPRKLPQLVEIANFLLSGSAVPPSAIAIAVPSKACFICCCRTPTLDCKVEMSCGAKLAVARFPAASAVTTLSGPDCVARLAADETPASV